MKIYRAIEQNSQSQGYYQNALDWYSQFGMTSHCGYDWACKSNQPIYFDCDVDGYVLNTEIDSAGGLGVNIITESEDGVYKHRYWHLKDFFVKAGDKVTLGDCIGWSDNTGLSTGTHLHRDMKEMEKNSLGSLSIKNHNNGGFGAIPFAGEKKGDRNWFVNKFVLEVVSPDKKEAYLKKVLIAFINKLKNNDK